MPYTYDPKDPMGLNVKMPLESVPFLVNPNTGTPEDLSSGVDYLSDNEWEVDPSGPASGDRIIGPGPAVGF